MIMADDMPMCGHLAYKNTLYRIRSHYFLVLNDYKDIRLYCASCDIFQKSIHKGSVPSALLGEMPVIETPFDRIAIEISSVLYIQLPMKGISSY